MIQTIGFLACAMLAVKLLEMGSNPAFKKESGGIIPGIGFALLFGWLAFVTFVFMLLAQGEAMQRQVAPEPEPLTQEQIDCITNAKPGEDILRCTP